MRSALLAVAAAGAVLAGCGPAAHSREGGAVTALAVRPVAWNPGGAQVGRVRAVADGGTVVAVFGDRGATILSAGAVVGNDARVTDWTSARTIAGADGSTRWIVGIDGKGHLYYVRGLAALEDVSSRYGLEGRAVRGAAMIDPGHVGFLLDGEIAVADGSRVTRYTTGPLAELTGGAGRGAGVGTDSLVLFGPATSSRAYALPGVTHAAIGPDGRLYAATRRAVFEARPDGQLALVYDAEADSVHGLVVSGDRVWFADGAELGIVDGDHVAETSGAHVASDASLAPSPSGDVWVLASGALQRFARVDPRPAPADSWATGVAPIFARICSECHQRNGSSGTDLSTPEAWQAERAAIVDRVVVSKSMPPEGHPLSDQDRQTIRAWAGGQ